MAKFSTEQQLINMLLSEFGRTVIAERRRNVRNEKAINTQELLNSYDYEVQKATIEQVGAVLLAYEEHGRFLDMGRTDRRSKFINIDAIIEWLRGGALSNFKTLPTNGKGETALNNRKLLNGLAWGVVTKIQRKGKTKKKRRKLQRGFESALGKLIDELRTGYQDRTIEQIKSSFYTKFQ